MSGPDGINAIPGTTQLYVGDVDFVRVVDTTTNSVLSGIRVGTTGFRADEGCFDREHNIYMISSPDADVPFASFISTTTQAVLATVLWTDPAGGSGAVAGGNEQCQYDAASHSFIVNNDGTVANPHGEVNVIPASSITALAAGATTQVFSLPGVKRFPLGNCDPTGLDLGAGKDIIVECRPGDAGSALTTLILDRTNGNVLGRSCQRATTRIRWPPIRRAAWCSCRIRRRPRPRVARRAWPTVSPTAACRSSISPDRRDANGSR